MSTKQEIYDIFNAILFNGTYANAVTRWICPDKEELMFLAPYMLPHCWTFQALLRAVRHGTPFDTAACPPVPVDTTELQKHPRDWFLKYVCIFPSHTDLADALAFAACLNALNKDARRAACEDIARCNDAALKAETLWHFNNQKRGNREIDELRAKSSAYNFAQNIYFLPEAERLRYRADEMRRRSP